MISLEQVVSKMAAEIDQAKHTTDQDKIKQHARAIKLLADLILDEEMPKQTVTPSSQTSISEQEMLKMIGSNYQTPNQNTANKYGQSDSKSLLDF
ncbi:YwdI family protein [Amphibacillus indicireducens]|uniref:YwdI family protein n=1 Tax=Amphibacillus indicireducens TaxID=1076330 RepID=A0ABP7W301_9BACI